MATECTKKLSLFQVLEEVGNWSKTKLAEVEPKDQGYVFKTIPLSTPLKND